MIASASVATPLEPNFLRTRRVQVAVDTSGYCQARCAFCSWPELENRRRVMRLSEFAAMLRNLEGFTLHKFTFNVINEPFVDAGILDKLEMLISSGAKVTSLFFSSNWLAPSPAKVDRFADLMRRAGQIEGFKGSSVNATVSGVDEETYDVLQAGRDLKNVVAPYRSLSFKKARSNVVRLAKRLSERYPDEGNVVLRIKGYGFDLPQERYEAYWRTVLTEGGVDPQYIDRRVAISMNLNFTTFARNGESALGAGVCQGGWLEDKVVVGPDGRLGLCCHESGHQVQLGSLFTARLQDIVATEEFQAQKRVTSGLDAPTRDHPCASCEFYAPAG